MQNITKSQLMIKVEADCHKAHLKSFSEDSKRYHHHQGKNLHLSSGMSAESERHLFPGPNGAGGLGLLVSSDAKPRLKWTPDLHDCFIEAVNRLGGAESKTYIISHSEISFETHGYSRINLVPLKSHLQKYRLSKNLQGHANSGINKASAADRVPQTNQIQTNSPSNATQTIENTHLSEAIQMQIKVQLEVQRRLQLQIEAQGKLLQAVFDKADEALGRPQMGIIGLESAKVQLADLVPKVSTQCLIPEFCGTNELSELCLQQTQTTNCLTESCLTLCGGLIRDKELQNNPMGLERRNFSEYTEQGVQKTGHRCHEDMNDGDKFLPTADENMENAFVTETRFDKLSMSIGLHTSKWKGNGNYLQKRFKGTDEVQSFNHNNESNDNMKPEKQKTLPVSKLPFFSAKQGLNRNDENDVASKLQATSFKWL